MNDRYIKGAGLWRVVVGFAASAVLLTIIQAPLNLHLLAWAAWVPFMVVCSPALSRKRLILCTYFVAFGFWLFNLVWLWPITGPGYIVLAAWQGVYWPALGLTVRYVRRRQWPLTVVAPVIFVGAEAIQSVLFTGFGWFFLAHSQYRILPLIQVADLFGTLGVSVLVAMVNGLVADGLLGRQNGRWPARTFWGKAVAAGLLLAAAFGYGHYRLRQTPEFVQDGPLVGAVQSNVPSYVKEETENAQALVDDLIDNSQACIDAGADLVAWPETMVLAAMNPGYLKECDPDSFPQQFYRQILGHARGQAAILFGAHAATLDAALKITDQYNSAYLFHPDGTPDIKRYDKIHLVPFGEYIPFHRSIPWVYRMILFLSPYDYDYNLTPGDDFTVFRIKDGRDRTYRFGVLICYEDTIASIARQATAAENGSKRVDFLVNLSNDGWYVSFRDGKVVSSAELSQRMAISVFRSIENRVAIIRSVNTGISCLIDSTGRIRTGYVDGTLPPQPLDRQAVEGWFTDVVPIDSRVTVFSRFGRWLDGLLEAALIALWIKALWDWKKNREKGS